MIRLHVPALVLAMLCTPGLAAAAQLYKCTDNGSTRYQQSPCPTDGTKERPTLESLNAERQQKLADEKAQGALRPAPGPSPTSAHPAAAPTPSFKCDGRQLCSQMSSCAEAKFFLANCPGAKMDGDRNGIPCEKQWCH
jgi:hypothetical protein